MRCFHRNTGCTKKGHPKIFLNENSLKLVGNPLVGSIVEQKFLKSDYEQIMNFTTKGVQLEHSMPIRMGFMALFDKFHNFQI